MIGSSMRCGSYLALIVGGSLAMGGAALAAQQGESAPRKSSLEAVCLTLAGRYTIPVVLDPELASAPAPSVPGVGLSLPDAMTRLCRPLPGSAWLRLALPAKLREGTVSHQQLADLARRLAANAKERLIMEGGAPRAVLLWTDPPPVKAGDTAPRELVVLYSTAASAEGRPPEEALQDLQSQQLASRGKNERPGAAYGETLRLFMALEPAERERFGRVIHVAGMRRWDATPPAERAVMTGEVRQLMERSGLFPGAANPGASPPAGAEAAPERRRGSTLKELAARITRRTGKRVVVEPSLLPLITSELESYEAPLNETLDQLVTELPGVAWCRVYLAETQRRALGRHQNAERLTDTVRALSGIQLEQASLAPEGETPARRFERRGSIAGDAERAARQAGLAPEPVYLLYSTCPQASGDTAAERLAGLQRAQFELMRRMSPDELERSLDRLLEGFDAVPPAQRSRLLSLPLAAAMMATWLPRQAQEDREGGRP